MERKRVAHGGLSPPAHSLCLNAFVTSTSSSLSPKGKTLVTRRACFRFVVCTLSVYSFRYSLSPRFKGPYISTSFRSGSRKQCILRGSGAGIRATTALKPYGNLILFQLRHMNVYMHTYNDQHSGVAWTWCIKKTNKFRSRNPHLAVSMRVRNITAPYTNGEHWMLLTNISLDTVHAQLRDVVSWIWKLPRCNLIDPKMPQLYTRCMHNGKRMKSTFIWRQITVSLLCSPILRSMSGPGLYPSLKKILGYFPIYTI